MNMNELDSEPKYEGREDDLGLGCGPTTFAGLAAVAEANDCRVITPLDNQLFIDIDSKAAFTQFLRVIDILGRKIGYEPSYTVSRSPGGHRGHCHIVVQLQETVDNLDRLLLQACLGSDPVRELLSWIKLQGGAEVHTCLFEKEGK